MKASENSHVRALITRSDRRSHLNTLMKRRSSVWQLIATMILLSFFGCGKSEQPQARPPEIEMVQVEQKDIPIPNE